MKILGIIASSLAKAITDTFNRTTSGSLGSATTGQIWSAIRGIWAANGTAASSSAVATDYALASISFGQNATLKLDTTGGCGPAFWVTDSGSWWAAFPHYSSSTNTTCTGGTVYCYSAGCTPANSCGTISQTTGSSTTCTGGLSYCYSAGCTPAGSCGGISESTSSSTTCTGGTVSCSDTTNSCSPGGCGGVSVSSVYTSGGIYLNDSSCSSVGATQVGCSNCGGCPSGFFCCQFPGYTTYTRTQNTNVTTTSYTRWSATNVTTTTYTRSSPSNVSVTTYTTAARILSSAAGTVTTDSTTTLATSTSGYTTVASMQVDTVGTTITAKAYTGAGQTTQLGSTITRTPTSPTRGTGVGIIKAPTTDSQGSTVDNFSATL